MTHSLGAQENMALSSSTVARVLPGTLLMGPLPPGAGGDSRRPPFSNISLILQICCPQQGAVADTGSPTGYHQRAPEGGVHHTTAGTQTQQLQGLRKDWDGLWGGGRELAQGEVCFPLLGLCQDTPLAVREALKRANLGLPSTRPR